MTRTRFRIVYLAIVILLTAVHPQSTIAKSIHVALQASWNATSASAEAVIHLTEVLGQKTATKFLEYYAIHLQTAVSDLTDTNPIISERNERDILFKSLQDLRAHRLSIATTRWVLSAHLHSPRVHFHHELSARARELFKSTEVPPVFAIILPALQHAAILVTDARQLSDVTKLPKLPTVSSAFSLFPGNYIPLFDTCANASQLPTLLLHTHLPHPSFTEWMKALQTRAPTCDYHIALRFSEPPSHLAYAPPRTHPALQAFVAHVSLRSTEYKVVDDRVFESRLFPDCPQGLSEADCRTSENAPVDFAWPDEVTDDSNMTFTHMQAALFVKGRAGETVDDTIAALALVAEDAPSVTRSDEFLKAGTKNDRTDLKRIEKSVRKFRMKVGDRNTLFLNGFPIDLLSMRQGAGDLIHCVSTLASAAEHFASVSEGTGRSPPPLPRAGPTVRSQLRVVLPVRQLVPNALVWFNDMFSDARYKKWPLLDVSDRESIDTFVSKVNGHRGKDATEATQHLQLVKTRAHHLSLLLVLDMADMDHLPYASVPESVVRADLPIRVGVVLVPNGRVSELVAASFYHFLRLKGRRVAVQFLGMIRQVVEYFAGAMGGGAGISEQVVQMAFQQIAQGAGFEYSSAAEVLKNDEQASEALKEARRFAEDMRLFSDLDADDRSSDDPADAKRLSMLCTFNGIIIKDIAAEVVRLAVQEQERIASLLTKDGLDGVEVANFSSDSWVEADNDLIVVNKLSRSMRKGESGRLAGMQKKEEVTHMLAKDVVAVWDDVNTVDYITADNSDKSSDQHTVTGWLAGDSHDSEGFLRLKSFVNALANSEFVKRTQTRLSIITPGSRLHESIIQTVPGRGGDNGVLVLNGRRLLAISIETLDDLIVEIASEFESASSLPSSVNGEISLLYQMYKREIQSACKHERRDGERDLEEMDFIEAAKSTNMSSLCMPSESCDSDKLEETSAPLSSLAVIDPVDPNAFVMVAVMRALRAAFRDDLSMTVIVTPAEHNMKAKVEPPKTFYKFLLEPDDWADYGASGSRFPTRVSFNRLPQSNVLTVAVEPPRALFVSSFATNHDMDNVILDNVSEKVDLFTEYDVKNLIVEGSCIDEMEQPPQGLQLVLANENGVMVDTLVMANLGYFQLKVPTPGLWSLSLAHGASSRIFTLKTMEMFQDEGRTTFEADSNGRVPIPVDSLSGAGGILLRVVRRPGMEGKSVLDPSGGADKVMQKKDEKGNATDMIGMLKSSFRNLYLRKSLLNSELGDAMKKDDTIHVFSVASGHLYERFLKIMISSVTKHATRKVKFWLLENYLSPSFKKLLPEFAKNHGAEVGMVTYRWPGWLRAQTEKQRIIWAYKILFLDVLFPLDVGRIIFVDSDQVVRGDLAELMNIDLKGAPYGYVPFCDSRKEVEGYRFWKQGFWKETLRGAKYRISALYVVDLDRFRETAAGDTLRSIYQSLSADPNSLSNLDQDLPNYASVSFVTGRAVPIFDLPQEWLWCETWCDDESKADAKAIDLCNNPDTKEPKLESAKRIISEWVELDDHASELTEVIYTRFLKRGHSSSSTRTARKDHVSDKMDEENAKAEL